EGGHTHGGRAATSMPTFHAVEMREHVARLPKPMAGVPTFEQTSPPPLSAFGADRDQLIAAHLAVNETELRRAQITLASEWGQAERAHPILVAFRSKDGADQDLSGLQGDSDDAARTVLRTVLPKLGNINKCYEWLKAGDLHPLKLDQVVARTKQ